MTDADIKAIQDAKKNLSDYIKAASYTHYPEPAPAPKVNNTPIAQQLMDKLSYRLGYNDAVSGDYFNVRAHNKSAEYRRGFNDGCIALETTGATHE